MKQFPSCPFFRIHLLTGLTAMLAASLLLWLNLRPQPTNASTIFQFPAERPGAPRTLVVTPYAHFGWPWIMLDARRSKDAMARAASAGTSYAEALVSNEGVDTVIAALEEDGPARVLFLPPPTVLSDGTLRTSLVLLNLAVALAILCTTAALCEALLRRRHRRVPTGKVVSTGT